MNKSFIFLFFLFCSVQSFSQTLIYKSNGNILNSEKQKISPTQVRELLKDNEKLLADYNVGRSKKTVGNVLLYSGVGFITSDIIRRIYTFDKYELRYTDGFPFGDFDLILVKKVRFPTALGYVGLTLITVGLPIKIGFSKKIRNVVTNYNNHKATVYNQSNTPKLDLITNSNGIGLRLSLN